MKHCLKNIILKILYFYISNISPIYPARCKFYPTCSQYVVEAIELYGLVKGLGLGILRILRCNYFSKGGCDPVNKKDLK